MCRVRRPAGGGRHDAHGADRRPAAGLGVRVRVRGGLPKNATEGNRGTEMVTGWHWLALALAVVAVAAALPLLYRFYVWAVCVVMIWLIRRTK